MPSKCDTQFIKCWINKCSIMECISMWPSLCHKVRYSRIEMTFKLFNFINQNTMYHVEEYMFYVLIKLKRNILSIIKVFEEMCLLDFPRIHKYINHN